MNRKCYSTQCSLFTFVDNLSSLASFLLFKNLRILNLKGIYKLQIGKFMYQYKSGLLPYSFNNMFLVTRQVHSYGTRSSELFYLPQCRTNIRKFSISFQDPNFFNSLILEIRNATSTASFCSKMKAFLLS